MNIQTYLGKIARKEKNHFWIFVSVLAVLSAFLCYRYSVEGCITPGHDAIFQYNRFYTIYESIINNNFPNYIDFANPNQYGYATNLFYPDLIFSIFAFTGRFIGVFYAYQLMLFSMTFLCGIFTFISAKKLADSKIAGYITAILYTFCFYRIVSMFERSSIAEALTFTFVPLLVWGLYEIIKGDYKKWYIFTISCSLFALTHMLSTVLAASIVILILIIYIKSFIKEPKRIVYLAVSGISTVLLSAYFLFPLLEQLQNDTFNINILENEDFIRLSLQDIVSGMFLLSTMSINTYKFLPSIGATLTFAVFLRFFIKTNSEKIKNIDAIVIISTILLFICSDILPNELYPNYFFAKIQFLWRYFEFISFGLALGGGYYISLMIQREKKTIALFITYLFMIVMMISINSTKFIQYTNLQIYTPFGRNKPVGTQDNNYCLGLGDKLEYLPVPVTLSSIEKRGNVLKKRKEKTIITNIQRKRETTIFDIKLSEKDNIELPLTYYKGYTATINNANIEVTKSKNGFVEIPVNQSGKVTVKFTGTFLQKYSIYITLVSSILLSIYVIIQNRKTYK